MSNNLPGVDGKEFIVTWEHFLDLNQLEILGPPKLTEDGWEYKVKFKGPLLTELKKKFGYE